MIGAAATVILAALTLTQVLSLALVLVPVLTHAETNVLKKMDHRENLFSASYWLLMVYGTCPLLTFLVTLLNLQRMVTIPYKQPHFPPLHSIIFKG